jgi:hypothetical protein
VRGYLDSSLTGGWESTTIVSEAMIAAATSAMMDIYWVWVELLSDLATEWFELAVFYY